MATWHQQRSKVKLYHDTKFSVVIDPPHMCRAVRLFDDETEAKRFVGNHLSHHPHNRGYVYILKPAT